MHATPGAANGQPQLERRENDRFPDARYNRRAMPEQPSRDSSPSEPDGSRTFALLLKLGADPRDAYASVQEVQSMAAENLIARFESRLEAVAAELKAEVRSFRWFIAAVVVLGVFLVALMEFVLVARGPG